MSAPNVISVQSHVAYGHVGNSAAVFALQRLGIEVWPVHTVQFSNHTGYPDWQGQVFAAEDVARLMDGLEARGALADCDALLSGYIGDPALGAVILDAAARIRAANPRALYLCDPVMGDHGRGLFVRDGVPDFLRGPALAAADIVTPNLFELEILTGRKPEGLEAIRDAAASLLAHGPKAVVVTSFSPAGNAAGEMEMLAVSAEGAWHVATPRLAMSPNGAGDAVAALLLGFYLKTAALPEALGSAAAAIFEILDTTLESGADELQLITAQDRLETPRRRFTVRTL
ncbi:pyridoxal kinase PdxY [Pelagibius sp.]|uniref:pyridoxal kinase PdxY n=1 Tax=Pelagibius sp. TaxID=1931238 RepID=UPI003B510DB9